MPFALLPATPCFLSPASSGSPALALVPEKPRSLDQYHRDTYRHVNRRKTAGALALIFRSWTRSEAQPDTPATSGRRSKRSFAMIHPGMALDRLSDTPRMPLPRTRPIPVALSAISHQKILELPHPPPIPREMNSFDRHIVAVNEFLDAQGVSSPRQKQGTGPLLEALYRSIESDAPGKTGHRIANLPKSIAMDGLVLKLAAIHGVSLEYDTHAVQNEEAARHRLVAEMLMSLVTRGLSSDEINVGGFNFLNAIRDRRTIVETGKNFAKQIFSRTDDMRLSTADWTANMILQRLHPELARTDTPTRILYGSLDWADLRFAIDLLSACGMDHAEFPYKTLMTFANHVIGGARLNALAGSFIWMAQIRTALWFAHAGSYLDLKNYDISLDGGVEKAVGILNRQRGMKLSKNLAGIRVTVERFNEHPVQENHASLLAAFKLKQALLPFYACVKSDSTAERRQTMYSCGMNLPPADITGFTLGSAQDRERYLAALLTRNVDGETLNNAGTDLRVGLALNPRTGRRTPNTPGAPTFIRSAGIGGTPDAYSALRPDFSLATVFLRRLAKMMTADPSLAAVGEALGQLGSSAIPHFVDSRPLVDDEGLPGCSFFLQGLPAVEHIENPSREALGVITIGLDGAIYQIDMLAPSPALVLLDETKGAARDMPLCREERTLPSGGCHISTAITDARGNVGRRIVRDDDYIQAESVWPGPERPRREHIDFFSHNSADLQYDPVVVVDQILVRPIGRSADAAMTYRRVALNNPQYPRVLALPAQFSAILIDRAAAERPVLQYLLTSDIRLVTGVDGAVSTRQVRTLNRRDFRSRQMITAEHAGIGVIEIGSRVFYRFNIPVRRGTQKVELRRTNNDEDAALFDSVPTVEQFILSGNFSVEVETSHASTIIKVLFRCGAEIRVVEAIRKALARTAEARAPVSSGALETYLRNYNPDVLAPPAFLDDDPVVMELNTALTEIMRSVTDTHAFRNRLRENYERMQAGRVTFGQLYSLETMIGDSPGTTAARAELTESLSLFSSIFTSLDFSAALQLHGSELRAAVNAVIARVFDIKKTRNFAIAEVTEGSGEVSYYFSVSGEDAVPQYVHDAGYTLVRDRTAVPASHALPHFPNLTPTYTAQAREFDTERLIFTRLGTDFPNPGDIAAITMYSRLDFCHSCTVCCIVHAEQHPLAKMRFVYLPPNPKRGDSPTLAK